MSSDFTPFNIGPYKNLANKGYNSWWNKFKQDKPEQTGWDFKGSGGRDDDLFSFSIGAMTGIDFSKDGLLDEDEFLRGIGDVFEKEKLIDIFDTIDRDHEDGKETIAKDGLIDVEELAAFLKTADANHSKTITYKEMNDFINTVSGDDSTAKTTFLGSLEENFSFLTGSERAGNTTFIRETGKDSNGNDISLFQGKSFSDFAFNKNSVYSQDAEDKDFYLEEGSGTSFFSDEWDYTDSDTLSSYNGAVFAHGLIESLGGKNGRLSQKAISEVDDANEKKFLQSIAGKDGDISAQEIYILTNIMDANKDGSVDSEEQEKFFDPDAEGAIKYARTRSSTYNSKKTVDNIQTLGDLSHYIQSVSNKTIQNPDVDLEAFTRAEKDIRKKTNGEIDEETYDIFKYFNNGSKIKKLFDESLEFTTEDQNPANTAAFIKGLTQVDTNGDGHFTAKELGNKNDIKKLVSIITGEEDGSLSSEDLAVVLNMADNFVNKDGKVSSDEMRKFLKMIRDLKEDSELSDDFDPFESNVFSGSNKMIHTEDFKTFFDLVVSQESDEGDANLFEIDKKAFDYVDDDFQKYNNFIRGGWSILSQLDNDKLDGTISADEYKNVLSSKASGLASSEKEKFLRDEMKKFSQLAGLAGDSSNLSLAEYTAAITLGDLINDNNKTLSSKDISKLRDMAFNRDSKDFDPQLKQDLIKLAQQIDSSTLYTALKDELIATEKKNRNAAKYMSQKSSGSTESAETPQPKQTKTPEGSGQNYEDIINRLLQNLSQQRQRQSTVPGRQDQTPSGYYHYNQADANPQRDFEASLNDYLNQGDLNDPNNFFYGGGY